MVTTASLSARSDSSSTGATAARFQLADVFIIITCVAASFAAAVLIVPIANATTMLARLVMFVLMLPAGLGLGGLVCMARARRRPPWTVGERVLPLVMMPYVPAAVLLPEFSLFGLVPNSVLSVALALTAMAAIVSSVAVVSLTANVSPSQRSNAPWFHYFGYYVGVAFVVDSLVAFSVIAFLYRSL